MGGGNLSRITKQPFWRVGVSEMRYLTQPGVEKIRVCIQGRLSKFAVTCWLEKHKKKEKRSKMMLKCLLDLIKKEEEGEESGEKQMWWFLIWQKTKKACVSRFLSSVGSLARLRFRVVFAFRHRPTETEK